MAIVPRQAYRTIDWYWHNLAAVRRAVREYEEDQIAAAGHQVYPPDVGRGIGKHGEPTALLAINIIEGGPREIRNYRRWLLVLDRVRKEVKGTDKEALINLYYEGGLNYKQAAIAMNVSIPTFYDRKGELVGLTYAAAIEAGLLRAFGGR
jgi:hypothetical protein